MTFAEFEAEALRVWEEIPEGYKEGIDAIVIRREHLLQGGYEDYYTLGTCSTEPYPSDYRGPETSRSILTLYHGSFARVAEDDPDFPWEEEIWETVTHELRHHLEHLAADDETEELDYAMEGTYLRDEGLTYDPWYFQSGVPIAEGVYRVEGDVYIEIRWRPGKGGFPVAVKDRRGPGRTRLQEGPQGAQILFEWDAARWAAPWPEEPGELHFLRMPDLDAGGGLVEIVLVQESGLLGMLRRLVLRTPPSVTESEISPMKMADAPGSPGPESFG
jgi:hypothetical protein